MTMTLMTFFYKNGGSSFTDYEDEIYRNLYDLASLNQHNEHVDQYLKDRFDIGSILELMG